MPSSQVEAIQQASGVAHSNDHQNDHTPRPPVDTRWQVEAKAVCVNHDCLRELYVSALEPTKYESAALGGVHTFSERSLGSLDARLATSTDVCGGYPKVFGTGLQK